MTRLQQVADYRKVLPTDMLWAEVMADVDSNGAAVQVLSELGDRKAL